MQPSTSESARAVNTFLQRNMDALQGITRSYVAKAGLAKGEELESLTLEIIHEATLEALSHAERFQQIQQPRAWFLGITANVVKRHRTAQAKLSQHETTFGSLFLANEEKNENDFFDRLSGLMQPQEGPEQEVETRMQVTELLALASPQDRRILRLAFLQDLDTDNLALTLGVAAGTARVRLHRALRHLRSAWNAKHQQKQERGRHA